MTDVFVLARGSARENKFAHPQVTKLTKAKVHVYSDSVLCLGKVTEPQGAAERWKGQLIPGLTSLEIVRKIQDDLQSSNSKPENFGDRIIFVSMFSDIDWNKKNNEGECISNSEEIRDYAKRFSQGHWTFLGSGNEEIWYGT